MASDALLLTHCGAQRVTRADLAVISAPARTATWVPIKHSDLLDALHAELARRDLQVRREQYAVQHQGRRLFGTLDLAWEDTGESAAALGLRTANDKSMALQLAIGLKILVCDNLCFAGDLIALKRKHTAGLDLPANSPRPSTAIRRACRPCAPGCTASRRHGSRRRTPRRGSMTSSPAACCHCATFPTSWRPTTPSPCPAMGRRCGPCTTR